MPELPDIVVYIEALNERILGQTLERTRIVVGPISSCPEWWGRPLTDACSHRAIGGSDDGPVGNHCALGDHHDAFADVVVGRVTVALPPRTSSQILSLAMVFMILMRRARPLDSTHDQRTLGSNRVSTGTPGIRPKGMSRPLEAAPSGSLISAVVSESASRLQLVARRGLGVNRRGPG